MEPLDEGRGPSTRVRDGLYLAGIPASLAWTRAKHPGSALHVSQRPDRKAGHGRGRWDVRSPMQLRCIPSLPSPVPRPGPLTAQLMGDLSAGLDGVALACRFPARPSPTPGAWEKGGQLAVLGMDAGRQKTPLLAACGRPCRTPQGQTLAGNSREGAARSQLPWRVEPFPTAQGARARTNLWPSALPQGLPQWTGRRRTWIY